MCTRMLNMVNTTRIEKIELYIEVVRVKPQVNQSVGVHIDLLHRDNYNVVEFDYGCGPSSGPVSDTGVYGDDEDYAYEEANDESDEDVETRMFKLMDMYHHSRLSTKFWRMSKGYMTHAVSCDVSNNPDVEEPDESSPVHYHLPPTPQFEHVENLGNVISSG